MNDNRPDGRSVIVVDLTDLKHNYLQSAPGLLKNYIDFADYVSIIVNTEPIPSYSDTVLEAIISLISTNHEHLLSTDSIEDDLEVATIYTDGYVSVLDNYMSDVFNKIGAVDNNNYERYIIQNWISPKTAIVSWC